MLTRELYVSEYNRWSNTKIEISIIDTICVMNDEERYYNIYIYIHY